MSHQINKDLGKLKGKKDASAEEKAKLATLEEVKKMLNRAQGTYTKPMLIDQINYLFGIVGRADQLPGKDVFDRLEELKVEKTKIEKMID